MLNLFQHLKEIPKQSPLSRTSVREKIDGKTMRWRHCEPCIKQGEAIQKKIGKAVLGKKNVIKTESCERIRSS